MSLENYTERDRDLQTTGRKFGGLGAGTLRICSATTVLGFDQLRGSHRRNDQHRRRVRGAASPLASPAEPLLDHSE